MRGAEGPRARSRPRPEAPRWTGSSRSPAPRPRSAVAATRAVGRPASTCPIPAARPSAGDGGRRRRSRGRAWRVPGRAPRTGRGRGAVTTSPGRAGSSGVRSVRWGSLGQRGRGEDRSRADPGRLGPAAGRAQQHGPSAPAASAAGSAPSPAGAHRPATSHPAPRRDRPGAGTMPKAASSASAIGRSKCAPFLGQPGGAEVDGDRLDGSAMASADSAARTRSRASDTALSGRPTSERRAGPGVTAHCTSTRGPRAPRRRRCGFAARLSASGFGVEH